MRVGKLIRAQACGAALAILGALFSPMTWGQDLDAFTISAEDAEATLMPYEISVETAERIAKACVAWAQEQNRRVSVVIVAPAGNIVYAYRMDGHNPVNVDTAQYKAETALYYRVSSHAARNRYDRTGSESMILKHGTYLVTGGLPIIADGVLIGAIGVGGFFGGDEPCAHQALESVVGPQPPLIED